MLNLFRQKRNGSIVVNFKDENQVTMKATSTVQTEKAYRYMKALVNHFSRKTNAAYEADSGYIEFDFGRCDIQAQDDTLAFELSSSEQDDLNKLKFVVDKHLTRFSQNEIATLTWQ